MKKKENKKANVCWCVIVKIPQRLLKETESTHDLSHSFSHLLFLYTIYDSLISHALSLSNSNSLSLFMSDQKDFRRRKIPANRRTARRSPPDARRRINPEAGRSLSLSPSEYANLLKSYKSEPFLPKADTGEVAVIVEEEVLYRPQTCTDLFLPPAEPLQVN